MEAHQLALEARASEVLENGRLADVVQRFQASASKPASDGDGFSIVQTIALATVAEEIADTIMQDFTNHVEEALKRRLAKHRTELLRNSVRLCCGERPKSL